MSVKPPYTLYSTSKDAWHAMYEAMFGAQKSIYWEVFILMDDDVGRRFFDMLENKARSGVDVKLIIDALGSFGLSKTRIASLQASGVDLHLFNERKHRYRSMWKMLVSRTHRKISIIDETTGFIGGVNVQKHMADWLDIHMKIEGKAVRSLLRAFAKMYLIAGGRKEKVAHLLKYRYGARKARLSFIFDDAGDTKSKTRDTYLYALKRARHSIVMFTPYYFPDLVFLRELWRARKRGVRVDFIIPFRTDVRLAMYAAYACFGLMKRSGIAIHLMKQMMHGKGIVVDNEWAMIGSSNIDQSSFFDNYEANVALRDRPTVERISSILRGWMNRAEELDEHRWAKRGVWHRIKEQCALLLYAIWFIKQRFLRDR